jgi:hypothetical protein
MDAVGEDSERTTRKESPKKAKTKSGRKTSYNKLWEKQLDGEGKAFGLWLTNGKNNFYGHCKLCRVDFAIDGTGISQVKSHSKSDKHKKNVRDTFGSQTRIGDDTDKTPVFVLPAKDLGTKCEIIWLFKMIQSNMPFVAADGMHETFVAMFPDSEIAKQYEMQRSKASYVIRFGLGPHLQEELDADIGDTYFSISFDESTTKAVQKQLDVIVRYKSPSAGLILARFLDTVNLGHASGDKIATSLMDILQKHNLKLEKLIALGRDGPNVNKTVKRLIDENLKALQLPATIDLGPCLLHTVQNAFRAGLAHIPVVEDLILDLHSWFRLSAARREDFKSIQIEEVVETHALLKHGQTRWLTLLPCVERLVEQYSTLVTYFEKEGEKSTNKQRDSYRRIMKVFRDPTTYVLLNFVASVAVVFQKFEAGFQKREPLIHLLYDSVVELTASFLSKFLASVDRRKLNSKLDLDREVRLPVKEMIIGSRTREELRKMSDGQQKQALLAMKTFFEHCGKYLMSHLPFDNKLMKSLRCLSPLYRSSADTLADVRVVVAELSRVLSERDRMVIEDEWVMYRSDPDLEDDWFSYKTDDGDVLWHRVDHFWRKVFELRDSSQKPKYTALNRLVSAALTLPHGQADVERGFSYNNKLISDDRTCLDIATVRGCRFMKDALRYHDPEHMRPENVPISKSMIRAVNSSRAKYQVFLVEEREKCEATEYAQAMKKKKKDLVKKAHEEHRLALLEVDSKMNSLKEEFAKNEEMGSVAMELLNDAQERLEKGLQDENVRVVKAASEILKSARKQMQDVKDKSIILRKEMDTLEKKKNHVYLQMNKLIEK